MFLLNRFISSIITPSSLSFTSHYVPIKSGVGNGFKPFGKVRDTYNDSFPLAYYNKNKDYYVMHPDTRELLEKLLTMPADEGEEATFKYIRDNIDWKKSNKY